MYPRTGAGWTSLGLLQPRIVDATVDWCLFILETPFFYCFVHRVEHHVVQEESFCRFQLGDVPGPPLENVQEDCAADQGNLPPEHAQ